MQEISSTHKQNTPASLSHSATSQSGIAIQLGLSHLIAGAVALGLSGTLASLHIQQFSLLLIVLATTCACGLLCTLNLQYSLYLLELTLERLIHSQSFPERSTVNERLYFIRRWPLGQLFLRLQEIEQRIQHYIASELLTTGLREKTLQQTSEAAALAERNRIARELHDSIKQQIFSISISAAAAKVHWQSENSEEAREAVEDIQRSAKEAQVEMQALLQQLRPAPLENTSLVEALQVQAQALGFRTGAQIHVDLGTLPTNDRLLPGTQEAIFRMVQETFANIARHARPRTIWLAMHPTDKALSIEIRDDGQGFDTTKTYSGMGLNNLQQRAQELHGKAEISSQPGLGTTVLLDIPLLDVLFNPAEEAHQRYELAHTEDLARRGYQLCTNASFLGMALAVMGFTIPLNSAWSIAILGVSLVAIYGYISGIYYRTRVMLNQGRESRTALELAQHQHKVCIDLIRMSGLSIFYAFEITQLLRTSSGRWLLIGILVCLIGFVQFSRRRYYLHIDRYYNQLSAHELGWELEERQRRVSRSLAIWFAIGIVGLFTAHHLFVLPPLTIPEQAAYGVAILLFLSGIGALFDHLQLQRWKQKSQTHAYNTSEKK